MSDEEKTPEVVEVLPKATWEHKSEFNINKNMREVIHATMKIAESEIAIYRRKIEKLTYGT